MRRSLAFSIVGVLFFSACAGNKSRLKLGQTSEGEVVEAEGLAPNNQKDLIGTKRSSLLDAQKNAVEKAVGVFVSGKTMVEKAVAIENNILARTDGYIKKYDVLNEGVEGEFYKTKIRALVALKDLERDLKSFSLLSTPPLRRPKVSISLKEEINKEESDEKVASHSLQQSLIDQGFVVVSDDRANEAEIVLKGKAASFPFQSEGLGGFISFRARMSVDVTRAGTNDIVLSVSKEASGLGGNEHLAGFKSLETVANVVGGELGDKLTEIYSRGGNLLVMVEGVQSFADVERIKKHLQSQPEVKDIMVRLYEDSMAQFDVQLEKSRPEDLAAHLEASQSLPLKVVESKNQTLRLKFESAK